MGELRLKTIARLYNDFPAKFGLPRQSGLVDALCASVIFETPYRNPDALRGLEGFSHLWLLWQFSQDARADWSPTVRPPRLGGNKRMGVFATRAPNRPNPIGLSAVRLERIEWESSNGPVLHVRGADLMNGTPIFDIKPYLAYADAYAQATDGFAAEAWPTLRVEFPPALLSVIPPAKREALCAVLAQDPRPAYQDAPERIYGMAYAGFDVRFTVCRDCLRVCAVEPNPT